MIPQIAFVVVSVLSCPNTKIENKSTTWNYQDVQAFRTASKRCPEIYNDSPCLKFFRKVEDGVYSALCGPPNK